MPMMMVYIVYVVAAFVGLVVGMMIVESLFRGGR